MQRSSRNLPRLPRLSRHSPLRMQTRRAARRDEGGSVLEFAILLPLLGLFLFGIIEFGFVLTYRHSVTQSASEGARAALIDYGITEDMLSARAAGRAQANSSMGAWELSCDQSDNDDDGLACYAVTHDCSYQISGTLDTSLSPSEIDTVATPDCITVVVTHDYASHPLLPPIPLLDALLPKDVASVATVQVTA